MSKELIFSKDNYQAEFEEELSRRLEILKEVGPLSKNPGVPRMALKDYIPVGIINVVIIIAYIWARSHF
jgi:hypothetical protein